MSTRNLMTVARTPAVCVVDSNGQVRSANPTFWELLNPAVATQSTHSLSDLVGVNDAACIEAAIHTAFHTHDAVTAPITVCTRNGTVFTNAIITELLDEAGYAARW